MINIENYDPDPTKIEWEYDIARKKSYLRVEDQLDMLWKAIDQGVFGEKAKLTEFYQNIKAVKELHPKGSKYKPYKKSAS